MAYTSKSITYPLSRDEIKQRYLACKEPRERAHWRMIWLMARKHKPLSIEEATKDIGLSLSWTRKVVRRFNRFGPTGIQDKRKLNRPDPLLNEDQQNVLIEHLKKDPEDGEAWTGIKVRALIYKLFRIKMSTVTGFEYLRRFESVLQTPRLRSGDTILPRDQHPDLIELLKKDPEDGGLWTGQKIAKWLSERVGHTVSSVTGWEHLRRYESILPRPRHRRSKAILDKIAATRRKQKLAKKKKAKR